MRKLFTIVVVIAAAITLLAGPVAAQSGSKAMDDQQLKKMKEFMKDSKVKPSGADMAVPPKQGQQPPKAAVQTPPKPVVQTPAKPNFQTPAKPAVQALPGPDKSKATYVGKVSDKMSPARKACVDKCESNKAGCDKRCAEGTKTNDVMVMNECVSCRNAIITCVNRCPAN